MPGQGPRDSGISGHDNKARAADRPERAGNGRARLRLAAGVGLTGYLSSTILARAQDLPKAGFDVLKNMTFGASEVIQIATFAGVMGAAMLSAIWLIRERGRIAAENLVLRERIAELNAAVQRAEAMLTTRDQRTVVWAGDRHKPDLVGTLTAAPGVPDERSSFLAFGRWLTARSAAMLDNAVAALREAGTSFDLVVEAQSGTLLEVLGRRSTSHAIVRFVSLTRRQTAHAALKAEHAALATEHEAVLALVANLDMPFWLRSETGRLRTVNAAYAAAVDCDTPDAAVAQGKELLATQARENIARQHLSEPALRRNLPAVVDGDRRLYSVTSVCANGVAAGLAVDKSDLEALRAEYERTVKSHAETLDQLSTAVAIYDADQKLRFYNQAFQKLWELDNAFLEARPDNTMFLDRLRSEGKLAEQPEWRRWKENLLSAYRAVEPQEHWWHIPDGRTIRVVASAHPQGGVTWVFENMTERFDLESRYNAAVRVQGETLDNLAEGVAVFGPDGRVRLFNPAFIALWRLDEAEIGTSPHIANIRDACERNCPQSPWTDFVAAVTGFDDERLETHGKTELADGTILSYAMIPLPNGQVMTTFVDVTDSVNFERALQDKNEALQKADQLKNDFVQHVSYELRSPLTNIIGFTELLTMPDTGPLNERQRDYVGHIASSSSVLLTIVNDILDLATVDAGIMQLEIGEVQVTRIVGEAAELIGEKLREHQIAIAVDTKDAPPSLHADENRLRQILFNLLSNAANYAPERSTIALSCRMIGDQVEFRVHDDGPGMPPEILDAAFERFEPHANGGRRRGAGLGLSIVKSFVELHGGTVEIETGAARGTTVTCRFPVAPKGARAAAE
ncbi:MAG: ATP-binding protein [Nitratireductor sp.]